MTDRQRFADFARISSDWLWETDSQDRFSYFSATVSASGLSLTDRIGSRRRDIAVQDPDNLARISVLDETIARHEPFRDVVYRVQLGDESPRLCSINGKPRYDSAGTFLGYRGVGRDVTTQVEAQQALEIQDRTLQAILRAMPDGVKVIDETGTSVAANDQLYDVVGIPNRRGQPNAMLHALRDMAERGEYGPGDPATLARERFETMNKRIDAERSVTYQRQLKTGRWIEARLHALGDSGYLSLYSDITQAKRHEAELERHATLLQTILANFPGGISVFDADGRLAAWNEHYADIIGADPAVVRVGATPREILVSMAKAGEFGPCDPEVAADRRLAFLRSGRMDSTERERPNGRVLEMRHGRLADGGAVSIYLDVTERKRAVRAVEELNATLETRIAERTAQLTEAQRFLNSLLASVPGMVYRRRQGRNGTIEFVSDGSRTLLGVAPDKILGRIVVYNDLIHPDDRARVRQKVGEDLTDCEVFNLEYQVKHVDGSWRWVHDRGRGTRGDFGEIAVLEGLITDITARKSAEHELARAHDNLSDATDSVNQGMTLYDREGRLVLATRPFYEAYPNADKIFVIGQTFEQVMRNTVEIGEAILPPGQTKEQVIAERVAQHKRADGTVIVRRFPNGRVLQVSDHPTRSGGIITVGTDITEQIKIEEQRRESQRMEAIGRLSGGLAHDLNNYFAVIMGNLDMLAELPHADPETTKLIAGALAGVERGAALTRSLLAFSQRQPLAPRALGLGEFVAHAVGRLRRTFGEKIAVEYNAPSDLWPVNIDAAQFDSAILALANNAREAMPDGGTIVFALRNVSAGGDDALLADHVLVEVRDTGSGMHPETLARVFEPFFSTKGAGHGTGLSLSMVHGFVLQSGGIIRMTSEVGRGTTVRIYLPRAADALVAASGQAKAPVSAGRSKRILVVDDNELVRTTVAQQLASFGYSVVEAESGDAAVILLEREGDGIDLVFSDIIMPGELDGYGLAKLVRQRWPRTKILLTSGFTGDEVDELKEQSLGVGVLRKPYRRANLAEAVRATLTT